MRILLDTHILLWAAKGALEPKIKSLLEDTSNDLYFSPVNIWEIELKRDKLGVDPKTFYQCLVQNGYRELALTSRHVVALRQLPQLHSDSLDRILLAQALSEDIVFLTADAVVRQYGMYVDCILRLE